MWHLHVLLFFYILFNSILFVLLHDVKEGKTAKLSVGGWRSGLRQAQALRLEAKENRAGS
jgi:hypothetical protein